MAKLFLLLLALLFGGFLILGAGVVHHVTSDSGSGWSGVSPDSEQSIDVSPAPLPVVVHSAIDNGPVSPESQAGYVIEILADGTVTSIVTAPSPEAVPGEETTAVQVGESHSIGIQGVETLLRDLEALGCFDLPTSGTIPADQIPDGGRTSRLNVTLFDQTYDIDGAGFTGVDAATLAGCQSRVAEETNIEWRE